MHANTWYSCTKARKYLLLKVQFTEYIKYMQLYVQSMLNRAFRYCWSLLELFGSSFSSTYTRIRVHSLRLRPSYPWCYRIKPCVVKCERSSANNDTYAFLPASSDALGSCIYRLSACSICINIFPQNINSFCLHHRANFREIQAAQTMT